PDHCRSCLHGAAGEHRKERKMLIRAQFDLLRRLFIAFVLIALTGAAPARAAETYTMDEIITAGHDFFGTTTGELGAAVERIFGNLGLPNGYVLGEEGAGAFIGGLTYGEGMLHTKNAGNHNVFWQGPSLGWDFGANGSRLMILVYNLDSVESVYRRYAGVAGSAYVVAGHGLTVLTDGDALLVLIRPGVGARLGVNLSDLTLPPEPTWNPF